MTRTLRTFVLLTAMLALSAQAAITWSRAGQDSTGIDADTGMNLAVVRETPSRYDFNGHKFATEAEARTFTEAYMASALVRHNLVQR